VFSFRRPYACSLLVPDLLLAQEVPDINVILGGHDHHVCQSLEGNTLVLKCGQNAYWLGVVDIILEVSPVSPFVSPSRLAHQATLPELTISVPSSPSTSSVVKRLTLEWQVLPVENIKPDPNISSIISHYLELYKEQDKKRAEFQNVNMEELLVTLEPFGPPLDTRSSSLRFKEGSGGNLVADSMRFRFFHYTCTGVPLLAVINGGHVRWVHDDFFLCM
jgi:2',3'-cyclic-nucleotide 2'-phosphodiesterase (5'-nucleotidase family)